MTTSLSTAGRALRPHGRRIALSLMLAAGMAVSVGTASARCRFLSIEEQFNEATHVYEASLALAEYVRDKRGDTLSADEPRRSNPRTTTGLFSK